MAADLRIRRRGRDPRRLPGLSLTDRVCDMTRISNPPHPGETLREDVLPALGLTVTEAAAQLGVTRAALSRVLNGRAAISPEMALRIEGWLGIENGGRADLWLAEQLAYDLAQARAKGMPKVIRARA
ncbi:HigA family addiction module antitoxin [Burkholderia gladioli]|uniref:HigA family addiction module antitoxin n=1 Tax=Burkholderia gladioli TaxID=28095 RepID=UPI003F7927BE